MAKFRRQHNRKSSAKMSSLFIKVIFFVAILCVIVLLVLGTGDFFQDDLKPLNYLDIETDGTSQFEPSIKYLPLANHGEVIVDEYISLAYDPVRLQPIWVAFELDSNLISKYSNKNDYTIDYRLLDKSPDPSLFTSKDLILAQYIPSYFYANNVALCSLTRHTSLLTLQYQKFYDLVWDPLYVSIKEECLNSKGLIVINGPIFSNEKFQEAKAHSGISIPNSYFIIILQCVENECTSMALLLNQYDPTNSIQNSIVTIDSISSRTDIQFFNDIDFDRYIEVDSINYKNYFECLKL